MKCVRFRTTPSSPKKVYRNNRCIKISTIVREDDQINYTCIRVFEKCMTRIMSRLGMLVYSKFDRVRKV